MLKMKGLIRNLMLLPLTYARICTIRNCFHRNSALFCSSSSSTLATATPDTLFPRQRVHLSRLMSPEESNIRGFIHGGFLIRLMEEAGFVAATRQIAFGTAGEGGGGGGGGKLGALARIDHLDFLAPVEVGDVVEVGGGVNFASPQSCRVSLQLTSASVVQPGKKERGKRLTNKANLWYVPLSLDSDGIGHVTSMPRVDLSDIHPTELQAAEEDYWKHKAKREKRVDAERLFDSSLSNMDLLLSRSRSKNAKPGSVEWTRSAHSALVDHHDCDVAGNVSGGALLKMADEVAGLAASKHTMGGTPTTACMDAVNFNKTIPKGSFVRLESHVTFAGGKSCEVSVRGDAVHIYAQGGPVAIPRAMEARFTFVAFDVNGSLKLMPSLTPETKEEKQQFEEGRQRYEKRKERRAL